MSERAHLILRLSAGLAVATFAAPALAHGGEANAAGWFGDGLVDFLVGTLALLYAVGFARLLRSARPGAWQPLPPWRVAAFAGAILALTVALLSPFEALADDSFAAHMGQHLLLMSVAAPLLASSNAHLVLIRAFPLSVRRGIGRGIAAFPGVKEGGHNVAAAWIAFAAFSVGLWVWHAPGLYDQAIANGTIHTLEHLTFLLTSIAFWRVIGTSGGRRLSIGMSVVIVSLVGLEGALLALLITLAPRPLYAAYAGNPDAMADQVMAGVLMWVPASLLYVLSSVLALRRLLAPAVPGGRGSSIA